MLTVERNSLPDEVMNEVRLFVDQHTAWQTAAWDLGRSDLTVKSELPGDAVGPVLVSALEGMMAFALVRPNPEAVFRAQAGTLLATLGVQTLRTAALGQTRAFCSATWSGEHNNETGARAPGC
jgi:TetR/AcrR family transcriptional repressor of nem operon